MDLDNTVPLAAFLDVTLGIVPAASTLAAETQIVNAVIEAARITRQVGATTTVDAQAGVRLYDLPIPEGYNLAFVEKVCVFGSEYAPTTRRPCSPVEIQAPEPAASCFRRPGCAPRFHLNTACGSVSTQSCQGRGFYVEGGGTQLLLTPPPMQDQDDAIEIVMSLIPSRFACVVPMAFFEQWKEEISVGAAAKLLRNGATYDRARRQDLMLEWERAKQKMRNRTVSNFTVGDISLLPSVECAVARKLL